MFINFKELKKQNLDTDTLLKIMEVIYNKANETAISTIILNEFVEGLFQKDQNINEFSFELSKEPVSSNDILIVSENGNRIITPASVVKIEERKVIFRADNIEKNSNYFVTYKY